MSQMHKILGKIHFGFGFWVSVLCVALAGLIGWTVTSHTAVQQANRELQTSREAALVCTSDMATEFHIHPKLAIVILGQEQTIPADIGIRPGCMNAIHTHSSDGIIHVESPVKKDFTLADFFAVWGKPFTKEQVLNTLVAPTNRIEVSVNGAPVDTFDQTILKDNDSIRIEVK